MPQLDTSTYVSQVFWLVVSFCLLLMIMRFVIVPRIRVVLDARARYIENYIRKAEKLQENALASLEKYDRTIAEAKIRAKEASLSAEAEMEAFVQGKTAETMNMLEEKIAESELSIYRLAA